MLFVSPCEINLELWGGILKKAYLVLGLVVVGFVLFIFFLFQFYSLTFEKKVIILP